MGRPAPAPPTRVAPIRVFAVAILFFGGGCAALIYELVWFQWLQLIVGSSSASMAVLLGVFMGGMGAGSLLAPRLWPGRDPLRVYALLEAGIGVFALILLASLPLVSAAYSLAGGALVVRALIAGVCLLPPTLMMGATLPVAGRLVQQPSAAAPSLGALYGANLAGATTGSLLAGLYLLRVFDMHVATYVAVAMNLAIAAVAWRWAGQSPWTGQTDRGAGGTRPAIRLSPLILIAAGVSGFTSLASQVIWTRLLALALGATVYVFSLILAVVLAGLGLGSLGATFLVRQGVAPRAALGACQWLLAAAMAWAGYLLTQSLPFWPIDPALNRSPAIGFELDLFRVALVVLPGAVLWGASFPFALAAAASPSGDPGRLVSRVYAVNTAGAVAGALLAGELLTAAGSRTAQRVLIVTAATTGVVLLLSAAVPLLASRWRRLVGLAVLASATIWSVSLVAGVPGLLVAYGRYSATWAGLTNVVYVGEGRHGSVAVSRSPEGVLTYHNAGKVQASALPEDMRLQRMLGHLSHLLPRRPASALVIGFGTGATAGALSIGPGVDRITIAEIEPLVVSGISPYFDAFNERVREKPTVAFRYDDARHVLARSDETYDVITSDLVDPWVKGTAALFTREFFELVRRRLNPGGVVTMFVQLYQSSPETVRSEIATFVDVFPNTVVWGNTIDGEGYDLVLTAQPDPIRIDVDEWQSRWTNPGYSAVVRSLGEVGIGSAIDLLSTYAGSATDLRPWLSGATINRDRHLRLQYLAALGLDLQQSGPIYAEMLRHTTFPGSMLAGSAGTVAAVREGLGRVRRR